MITGENTCDWGQPGQMQVNSRELTLTRCVKRVEDKKATPTHEPYSVWVNESFSSEKELDERIEALVKNKYHLIG